MGRPWGSSGGPRSLELIICQFLGSSGGATRGIRRSILKVFKAPLVNRNQLKSQKGASMGALLGASADLGLFRRCIGRLSEGMGGAVIVLIRSLWRVSHGPERK